MNVVKNIQISMFDFIEPDLFTSMLQKGSNKVEGKERIRKAAASGCDLAGFLKNEYGIGGWSGPGEPSVWFDGTGYYINRYREEEQKYPWVQVAKRIRELIAIGMY